MSQLDPQRPAPVARTYIDKHGNTSTMNTAGIGRLRPVDPDRDYTIRDDPRQLDIENVAPRFDTARRDDRGQCVSWEEAGAE